ncbi:MAG: HNH endonuclease [Verrucomicrobiae bacterium]|nr:HNH endonuclease [Verrucomicrobiae bacterium]
MDDRSTDPVCPLCGREIPAGHGSRHHLTPVLKGGRHGATELLHNACHSKLHAVFTESELARNYNTIEKLLAHEEIAKFVEWIRKRPPEFHARNRSLRKRRK